MAYCDAGIVFVFTELVEAVWTSAGEVGYFTARIVRAGLGGWAVLHLFSWGEQGTQCISVFALSEHNSLKILCYAWASGFLINQRDCFRFFLGKP